MASGGSGGIGRALYGPGAAGNEGFGKGYGEASPPRGGGAAGEAAPTRASRQARTRRSSTNGGEEEDAELTRARAELDETHDIVAELRRQVAAHERLRGAVDERDAAIEHLMEELKAERLQRRRGGRRAEWSQKPLTTPTATVAPTRLPAIRPSWRQRSEPRARGRYDGGSATSCCLIASSASSGCGQSPPTSADSSDGAAGTASP